jgi:hypothetical protein
MHGAELRAVVGPLYTPTNYTAANEFFVTVRQLESVFYSIRAKRDAHIHGAQPARVANARIAMGVRRK